MPRQVLYSLRCIYEVKTLLLINTTQTEKNQQYNFSSFTTLVSETLNLDFHFVKISKGKPAWLSDKPPNFFFFFPTKILILSSMAHV